MTKYKNDDIMDNIHLTSKKKSVPIDDDDGVTCVLLNLIF
jgi:hypothetical protein